MTGFELRGRMTMREFNMKRPGRRTFDQWIADLQKLSGKRDVSQDDLTDTQVQAAFAEDPLHAIESRPGVRELFEHIATSDQFTADAAHKAFADTYAAAECADGRARERNPDEIRD